MDSVDLGPPFAVWSFDDPFVAVAGRGRTVALLVPPRPPAIYKFVN